MTTYSRPLVSIIVPVYNVERYLDCCLNSIREQTYDRLEIIVVEDCSTDDSLEKLQPHLGDSRVRLVRHGQNSGLSAARNTGIEAATGDFVMFVDSDDVIAPSLVESCVIHAQASGADVLVYDYLPFFDGEDLPHLKAAATTRASKRLERVDYLKLPHFAWLKFIRAELLSDSALRFPVGYYYEDWPFHWELGLRAELIHQMYGAWLGYRQRATSITGSTGAKLIDQFAVQRMVLEKLRLHVAKEDGQAFAQKVHRSFWAVLMRVDKALLPKAIHEAQELQRELRLLELQPAPGLRTTGMETLISLPGPIATFGLSMLRGIRRLMKPNPIAGTSPKLGGAAE